MVIENPQFGWEHTHTQTHTYTQFAQVAELVDALVSNTNVFTDVPVRLRPWVLNSPLNVI